MQFTVALIAAFAALASAAPALETRQFDIVAVGNKYNVTGCPSSGLIFADPIFGNGNVCQPLSRPDPNTPPSIPTPILSYKTLSTRAGCSGESNT
jgi:hypothetical protein